MRNDELRGDPDPEAYQEVDRHKGKLTCFQAQYAHITCVIVNFYQFIFMLSSMKSPNHVAN